MYQSVSLSEDQLNALCNNPLPLFIKPITQIYSVGQINCITGIMQSLHCTYSRSVLLMSCILYLNVVVHCKCIPKKCL